MSYIHLVLVKFPGCNKPYLFQAEKDSYYRFDVGDSVIVATSRGKQEGVVVAKDNVLKGSTEAWFIDSMNEHRKVEYVVGVVKYFPGEETDDVL